MEKTIPDKKEGSLLAHARARLNPEIFSHPVWIRFNRKETPIPPEAIQRLLDEAQQLQHENARDACQLMLMCAAHQNYAGENASALQTTQQALAFAERSHLSHEMIWATWAACALCVQDNNYEQAARYLEYLQTELIEEDEWMLADLIEVLKQSLSGLEPFDAHSSPDPPKEPSHDDLLSLTLDWLHQWGSPYPLDERSRGDRRGPTVRRIPLWDSIVGAVRSSLSSRTIERPSIKDLPSPSESPALAVFPSDLHAPVAGSGQRRCERAIVIPVVAQMLGSFSITIQDTQAKLTNSRGLSVLKFLLFHHKQDIPREILMEVFWPEADPEASRNNLNVAMHSLRQALRVIIDVPIIRFEDGAYGLAADLDIWLDVEEFDQCIREGRRLEAQNQPAAALAQYEIAVNLYQEDFLADSPYEDWTLAERERLQVAYLDTLDRLSRIYFSQEHYAACIAQCQLILARDLCREDVHCRLMQCYSRLGQGPLALRQYQICVEALRVELDLDPAPETIQLYQRVRHREWI